MTLIKYFDVTTDRVILMKIQTSYLLTSRNLYKSSLQRMLLKLVWTLYLCKVPSCDKSKFLCISRAEVHKWPTLKNMWRCTFPWSIRKKVLWRFYQKINVLIIIYTYMLYVYIHIRTLVIYKIGVKSSH